MHEETISSKKIYQGRLLGLRDDTVKLENGRISNREICEHPGAVAIIAFTPDNKVVLIKQYRKPVEKVIYEVPAGLIEEGESLKDAAVRELEEETGYRAGKIEKSIDGFTSPGYSTEILHFFIASQLKETKKNTEEDEHTEVHIVSLEKAHQMVEDGRIEDNKTIAGIYLAERYLKT